MKVYTSNITNSKQHANRVKSTFADRNSFFLNKNISFKRLPKVSEAIEAFGEDFGKAAKDHFKDIIEKAKGFGLEVHNDTITFSKEKSLSKKVLEMITYPVTGLPLDVTNGVINGLKRIPFLKNNSWLSDLSAKPILKNRSNAVKNKSNVAAIKHYFELVAENGGEKGYLKRFLEGHTRLKPNMPKFSSQVERPLNRVVTGLIPAFFLANDAFNLSMYMNNDKETATKEKKRRFNQEFLRIGINVAATFSLISLFAKQCNKSIPLTAGITAGMVLVSEVLGRLIAGNPILPVSTEKAKEYAEKRNEIKQNNNSKPVEKNKEEKAKEPSKPAQKEFLTLSNILKVLGGLVALGFAVDKVSNIPKVSKKLGQFNDWYKGLFTEKFTIKREHFNDLTDKLDKNGFDKIANFYEDELVKQKGKILTIGYKENKIKYFLIHQVLTFPVRFVKNVALMPYNKIVKPLSNVVKENLLGMEIKKPPKISSKFKNPEKIQMLQDGINFLKKIEKDLEPEFTKKINKNLISSFDNITKSKNQNADLNVAVKTAASAVTTGFLIADNYNLVMIDSQGNDKELAKQKARERAIQRGTRLTYEAFILKMMMDMFQGVTTSLAGALAVSGVLRVITEMVERKAVGLPLGESSKEEIQQMEKEHLTATGLKGSYFRTMAKLAGKKTMAERRKNDKKS